jgi:hypothetical protein
MNMVRFIELGSILEPGRPAKTDKAAILIDAVRMVTQLRGEAQKLKDANMGLQEKIKELKVKSQFIFGFFLRISAYKNVLQMEISTLEFLCLQSVPFPIGE